MSDGTISESGNSIDNTPKGRLVFVPEGHAFYTFPVPAISNSTDDDGAAILDSIAGPLRGAAAHVTDLIDEGEDG